MCNNLHGSFVTWYTLAHFKICKEERKMESKQTYESELTEVMENELTDEQLLQLAEGSCTWGANCGS